MNPENENHEDEISLKEIIAFLKKRMVKILLRGVVSLGFVLLILLLLYAFLPYSSNFYRDIVLLLQKPDNVLCYPNGKAFSISDIISPLVLKEVYENNQLKDRIEFSKFRTLFSIANSEIKQEELDAEYRKKMSQRNLTVVDLQALEREYKLKKQTLSNDTLRIAMNPPSGFSRMEVTKIINEIPEAWFNIYSKLEAPKFPQIEASTHLKELRSQANRSGGYLILFEKTRLYNRQLLRMCAVLNEMLLGRNISLPSGEFLGDIQKQLESIDRYQLNVFRTYILMHPKYQGTFDKVFIYSNLQNIDQALIQVNIKHEGVMESLNILQSKIPDASMKAAASGKKMDSGITLQLDESFFNQFADMVRNDINNALRATYAKKAMEYGEQRAELEAEKAYFQQLLKDMENSGKQQISYSLNKDSLEQMLKGMYADLFSASSKVIQFRDMITTDYLSSRSFYVPVGNVQYQNEFRYPFRYFLIGLIAIWGLYNLVCIGWDFYQMNIKGCLKEQK